MTHSKRWVVLVMVAALPLVGYGEAPAEKKGHTPPATLEPTQDPAIKRVRLTEQAAERLGIQFGEVRAAGQWLEAPYSALFYDASGGQWLYISPQPLVFERARIRVERIEKDKMYLSEGPHAGTKVVTVGATLLFGAESGL